MKNMTTTSTRQSVIDNLKISPNCTPAEIATVIGKSASTVRRALKVLFADGIVEQSRTNGLFPTTKKGQWRLVTTTTTAVPGDLQERQGTPSERAQAALKLFKGNRERAELSLAAQGDREGIEALKGDTSEPAETPEDPEPTPSDTPEEPVAEAANEEPETTHLERDNGTHMPVTIATIKTTQAATTATPPVPKHLRAELAYDFLRSHSGTFSSREVATFLRLTGRYAPQAAVATLTSLVKAGKVRKIKAGKTTLYQAI